MAPTNTSIPRESPNSPCPSDGCFKIGKWIFFTYSLGAFQTASFVVGPRVSESIDEPFKSRILVPYSPLGLLNINPVGFQTIHFGGLSLQCWSQGLGCLMWGTNPSLLRKKLHICEILPDYGWAAPKSGIFGGIASLFFPPSSLWPFYPLFWRC